MTATTQPFNSGGNHALRRAQEAPRLSTKTKAAFKTTEFIAYIVLLTLGYLGSRGIAKSGSTDSYTSKK